jgi:hypothetical protein
MTEDRRRKTEGRRRKSEAVECGLRPIGACAYAPVGIWNGECGKKEREARRLGGLEAEG